MAIGRVTFGDPGRSSAVEPREVVSEFQTDHPRLARNLLHILTVERTSRAEQLVKGFPKTLEEYKYNVGIIEGLDLAIAAAKAAKEKAEA